jgi:hypothetical protein
MRSEAQHRGWWGLGGSFMGRGALGRGGQQNTCDRREQPSEHREMIDGRLFSGD